MAKLSEPETMYLLHAMAYVDDGASTRGLIQARLPVDFQDGAQGTCKSLLRKGLLEEVGRRINITEAGVVSLVTSLRAGGVTFTTAKGPRILNALTSLFCKDASVSMSYERFVERFRDIYYKEKLDQERRGVVAIHTNELRQKFIHQEHVTAEVFNAHLARLKADRQVFTIEEMNQELIRWAE